MQDACFPLIKRSATFILTYLSVRFSMVYLSFEGPPQSSVLMRHLNLNSLPGSRWLSKMTDITVRMDKQLSEEHLSIMIGRDRKGSPLELGVQSLKEMVAFNLFNLFERKERDV